MHLFWTSFIISLCSCVCVSVHLFCKYVSFGSLFSYMCVSVHLFCTPVLICTWKQTYKTVIYECKCSEYYREVLLLSRSVFISVHPIQFGVSSKRLKFEDRGWRFRLKIEIEIVVEIGCWDWRLRLADTPVRGMRGQSVYTDCHVRGGGVMWESHCNTQTLMWEGSRVRGESCEMGTHVRGESVFVYASVFWLCNTMQHTATHCHTMQHALQHTSTCGVERAYNIC